MIRKIAKLQFYVLTLKRYSCNINIQEEKRYDMEGKSKQIDGRKTYDSEAVS